MLKKLVISAAVIGILWAVWRCLVMVVLWLRPEATGLELLLAALITLLAAFCALWILSVIAIGIIAWVDWLTKGPNTP